MVALLRRTILSACLLIVLFILLISALPTQAATLTVTTRGPGGGGPSECTIAEAVERINAGSDGDGCTNSGSVYGVNDTIIFASDVSSARTNDTLSINSGRSLTISDPEGVTVERVGHGTTFSVSGQLTLTTITVSESATGIAVGNTGTLILNNSAVIGNQNSSGGAGIASAGSVTLNASRVNGNTSTGGSSGAGIAVISGSLTLNAGSQVIGNHASGDGGGIYIFSGSVSINGTSNNPVRIEGNSADGSGGAIYQLGGSTSSNGACITGNGDTAIYRNSGSSPMNMGNNWWGSSYGPYSPVDGYPFDASNGDSVESFADMGISYTSSHEPPTGNWMATAPSGCRTCTAVSSNGGASACY